MKIKNVPPWLTALSVTLTLALCLLVAILTVIDFHGHGNTHIDSKNSFVFHEKLHKIYWTRRRRAVISNKLKYDSALDQIFISIKTSSKFHKSRLDVILKTWFKLAKSHVSFASYWPACPRPYRWSLVLLVGVRPFVHKHKTE